MGYRPCLLSVPDCREQFRSLHQARLFVMNTAQAILEEAEPARREPERLEYFWLCHSCSKSKRVIADVTHGMTIARI